MNVLWVTNSIFPEASHLMKETTSPFGGWFVSAAAILADQREIKLSIAFPKTGLNNVLVLNGNRKTFYGFPPVRGNQRSSNKVNACLEQILKEVEPDIVHIFGTEYAHTLAMVNACNERKIAVVISIQGLTSIVAKYYLAGIPGKIQRRYTFRDMIKQDNLRQQQKKFANRGSLEIEALQKVKNIIGRTTWDRACISQMNPCAKYHFCNETLRGEFYKHRWDIDRCERHSIFVSQGSYPIKGLHFMLEAMPLILKRFPDTKLYVGGHNIIKSDTLKDRLKRSSYGKYIEELIGIYSLESCVRFTGILDEKQMCGRYLRSNVFVCPSTIENSPNSLGEAMILGVPCVAAYVGGIPDLLKHQEEGFLYPTDAPYILAHYVCEVFADNKLASLFSLKAREHAAITHNREVNLHTLISIYETITANRH